MLLTKGGKMFIGHRDAGLAAYTFPQCRILKDSRQNMNFVRFSLMQRDVVQRDLAMILGYVS
jgi:hypothetical protein